MIHRKTSEIIKEMMELQDFGRNPLTDEGDKRIIMSIFHWSGKTVGKGKKVLDNRKIGEALIFYFYDNMTLKEIGKNTANWDPLLRGISTSRVRMLIAKGLRVLRQDKRFNDIVFSNEKLNKYLWG